MHRRLKRALLQLALPKPVTARHTEYSLLVSLDDDPGAASPRLIDVALRAAAAAQTIRFEALRERIPGALHLLETWPGEHYRLLAALVQVLQPKRVIEIGTCSGDSALALLAALPPDGRLTTFDLVPWQQFPHRVLREEDFADGRLVQQLDDVTHADGLQRHEALFRDADLVFIDAAKDGQMEARLVDLLVRFPFRTRPLLVFDDIRLWNMLAVWRTLPWPKLDVTSFGHWTGTGLAEWRPAAEARSAE